MAQPSDFVHDRTYLLEQRGVVAAIANEDYKVKPSIPDHVRNFFANVVTLGCYWQKHNAAMLAAVDARHVEEVRIRLEKGAT